MPLTEKQNAWRHRRRVRGCAAVAEALEDRRLLTAVVVNTILDTTGTAQTSLRDAIAIANSSTTPTTITFDPTVFATPQTISLGSPLILTNANDPTTITGPSAMLTLKADGVSTDAAIQVGTTQADYAVQAIISNLTAINGEHDGAIACLGTVTLSDVIVTNCPDEGLEVDGHLTLNNVLVSNSGNGINVYPYGSVTGTNVTVANNTSSGLVNDPYDFLPLTTVSLTNSVVSGNGGLGIGNTAGTMTLTDVTIAGNSDMGISNSATLTLQDCTISANGSGGLATTSSTTISNTIIAGNTPNSEGADVYAPTPSTLFSLGYNLIGDTMGSSGWISTDLTGTPANPINPKLSALGNYGGPTLSMVPMTGSPAIDAGSNLLVPMGITTDQRGLPRIVGASVDVGADEVQTVEDSAPVVTLQPNSQTLASGAMVTFTAAASGVPAPTVQWQTSSDGTTFSNIPGATSASYACATVAAQTGNLFRAVFTNAFGTATTNSATLTLYIAPTVTQDPADQTVNAGATATFSAAATGNPTPTIQWQVSPTGFVFTDIGGATSNTYSFSPAVSQGGDYFRAEFTNSQGTTFSNAAMLVVIPPPSAPAITTQPMNDSVTNGGFASFVAGASGFPVPAEQWQVSTDRTTFTNIPGAISQAYQFTAAPNQNGELFRAVFTNSQGSATSNAGMLTVRTVPAITTQPRNQSTVNGQSATFTAAASGIPTPTVQWQISTNGTTFSNISGATAATYAFNSTLAQNGNLFRAVFNNSQGSATTSAATLTVAAAPAITTQPQNQNASVGQSVSFIAAATGSPAPAVQWQTSTDGTTFTNISGATSPTYTFTAVAGQNGNLFRAVFTNSQGSSTSTAATLTVTFAPIITTEPQSQSAPNAQNVTFTASASGNPAPTVQWQVSVNGTTFNDISGQTSAVYTFLAGASLNGDLYRAVFSNSKGTTPTNPATLTVTANAIAPAITAQPGDQDVMAGNLATFSAASSGSPTPSVQWQVSTDGTTFNDIPGAISDTYAFDAVLGQNGDLFRAVFSNSQGSATTNAASLMVTVPLAAPAITTQPTDQSGPVNQNISFTAAASGNPMPTVQWQISTDGTTFNDIPGATSATYTVTIAAYQNGYLFRAVFTNSQGSATTNPAALSVTAGPIQLAVTTLPPSVITAGRAFNVVISADDSAGSVDSSFAGTVTLAAVDSNGNSVGLGGTSMVPAVNGVASFTGLSIAQAGTYSISASASGAGGTSTANFTVVAVGVPPPAIAPSIGHVTLSPDAVVGLPFSGKVPVIVTNSSAATLEGKFTINLYANANPSLAGGQTPIAGVHSNFALKSTRSRTINVNVRSLPATLGAGSYYIVIEVIDPNGGTSVTASAQPFELAAPKITLNLSPGDVLPASIALNHSGSIRVTVTNTGNVTATGPLSVTLGTSADGTTSVAGVTLARFTARHFRLRAGKSAKFTLHFKVTDATATGSYFPYLTASLAGAMQTAVGAMQFMIG